MLFLLDHQDCASWDTWSEARAQSLVLAWQIDNSAFQISKPRHPSSLLPLSWNPCRARRADVWLRVRRGHELLSGLGTSAQRLGVRYSLPDWIASACIKQYGEDSASAFAEASNAPGPIVLRRNAAVCQNINSLRERFSHEANLTEPAFVQSLVGAHYNWETGLVLTQPAPLMGLPSYTDGWFEVRFITLERTSLCLTKTTPSHR